MMDAKTESLVRLGEWHRVAGWLDYAAAEFVADQSTRCYLEHVAQTVREEGERRHSRGAGLEPVLG
jgi:hypothetical protein